jgi:tetratricopeptide (TPR) repeat protein
LLARPVAGTSGNCRQRYAAFSGLVAGDRLRYFSARKIPVSLAPLGDRAVNACRAAPTRVSTRSARVLLRAAVVGGVFVVALGGCQYTAGGKNATGVQYYQMGRYQEAAQLFTQAIQQKPTNADGYYNLAATYHQLGKANRNTADYAQAEALYNKALDLNPANRDAYRSLGVLLAETNRGDAAQRLMESWQRLNPASPDPKVELARLREEFGDRSGAKEYLQQALAADPYDTRALAALGRIQEVEGNTAQALANYQRSLFRNASQPEVQARVASLRGMAVGGSGNLFANNSLPSSGGTFVNNSAVPGSVPGTSLPATGFPTTPNLFSAPAGDRTVTQPPALLR